MNRRLSLLSLLALGASLGFGTTAASAQAFAPNGVPVYTTWAPEWDAFHYDRHHVMLGEVVGFEPYRVTLRRRNGVVQTVDLKNGTVILPTGSTPTPGERVALVGYYSRGTFVVNRLLIR